MQRIPIEAGIFLLAFEEKNLLSFLRLISHSSYYIYSSLHFLCMDILPLDPSDPDIL